MKISNKPSKFEIESVLDSHYHWLCHDIDGWENLRADLSHMDLSGMNLAGRCLQGIDFQNTVFDDCDLKLCDMSDSNLNGASFKNANLTDAIMTNTSLKFTRFNNATVIGLQVDGSVLDHTLFMDLDMIDRISIKDCTIYSVFIHNCDLWSVSFRESEFWNAEIKNSKILCCDFGHTLGLHNIEFDDECKFKYNEGLNKILKKRARKRRLNAIKAKFAMPSLMFRKLGKS